mmetsp:Transcript_11694/g.32568  ORF Transcript_11694/g.32568 Transcript_11694/m.32568 type:complete len:223 (-) Transcript_11694:971-1639(-)
MRRQTALWRPRQHLWLILLRHLLPPPTLMGALVPPHEEHPQHNPISSIFNRPTSPQGQTPTAGITSTLACWRRGTTPSPPSASPAAIRGPILLRSSAAAYRSTSSSLPPPHRTLCATRATSRSTSTSSRQSSALSPGRITSVTRELYGTASPLAPSPPTVEGHPRSPRTSSLATTSATYSARFSPPRTTAPRVGRTPQRPPSRRPRPLPWESWTSRPLTTRY